MLPVLMTADQPKWYNHDTDLKDGDVVYFRKSSSAICSPWSMGLEWWTQLTLAGTA